MIEFGTGGFRGVIGDDFTRENAERIAQALASRIRAEGSQKPVAVGYDRRFMSEQFAAWIAEVLAGNGVSVLLYTDAMSSPAVMCAVRDEGLDYGVMLTASHNPAIFNGIKLFLRGGCDADAMFTAKLEKEIAAVESISKLPLAHAKARGLVKDYCNKEAYLAHIGEYLRPRPDGREISVLYDNLCGVTAETFVPLAARFHLKRLDVLHRERDALFAGKLPNPTREMMLSLKEQVLAGGYDYAMATDSDGDRLGILDERGELVDNNEILAALYYYLVRYRGFRGDIVKNCATSVLIDKMAEKLGFACHEVDVGFKNISAAMRETDALMGGESSGGFTCRGYLQGKDSTFGAALFLEMRIAMKKPVSEIVKEAREFADYRLCVCERAIPLKDAAVRTKAFTAMPALCKPILKRSRFGGNVKYYFDGGCWALLRFSGTEPMIRIFAEAETDGAAQALAKELAAFIDGEEDERGDHRAV